MTATGFGLDNGFIRKPSGPAETRIVNHSRLGKALLELSGPPIRSLFVAANNPAVTCPDSTTVRRGLAREDLFTIVHDPFLSDTARYADIVLPAATYLESEDVVRSYGTYYMQMVRPVVPPQGESWSNGRLAQELAQRLGLKDPIFSMDTEGLLRELLRGATSPAVEVDLKDLPRGRAIKLAPQAGASASRPRRASSSSTLRRWPRAGCPPCPTGSQTRSMPRLPPGYPLEAPDRARLLPGAHGVCRGRRLAEAAGRAGVRAAPRRRGRPRAPGRLRGRALRTTTAACG